LLGEDHLEPCKHIWAALLAAEARNYLCGSGGGFPKRLDVDERVFTEWYDPEDEEEYDADAWHDEGEDDPYTEDDDWDDRPTPSRVVYSPPRPALRQPARHSRSWKQQLASLRATLDHPGPPQRATWPTGREILYVVDVPATLASGKGLVLEVAYHTRLKDGSWSALKSEAIGPDLIPALPEPADRELLALLRGAQDHNPWGGYSYYNSYYQSSSSRYVLTEPQQQLLVPRICQTGRCRLRVSGQDSELRPIQWDEAGAWEFWLEVRLDPSGKKYLVEGWLRRGQERMPVTQPHLLTMGSLVFWEDRAAPFQDFGAFDWIILLRGPHGSFSVPAGQKEDWLAELLRLPRLPRLELPDELRYQEVTLPPRPRLKVRAPERRSSLSYVPNRLTAELSFDYDGSVVSSEQPERGVYQSEQRRLVLRDPAAEHAAAEQLQQLGFRKPSYTYYSQQKPQLELTPRHLPRVVRTLLASGWHVEAEGKLYRNPGAIHVAVESGIDWFDLHGTVEFGDTVAHLPELLAALQRGENTVRLDDGTFGLLPEEWLKKYGLLAGLGRVQDDKLRFSRNQVGLLDALLAAQPEATFDAGFQRARDALQKFTGIQPAEQPAGFVGQLRDYQRDGLGWLEFLQHFGFGGCLADDMGLGKTIQVLALLESRRQLRSGNRNGQRLAPSLVVVPKSLVFNWKQEAARFTPKLRVLDHTGIGRQKPGAHFDDYDLVLTTYGTLRRDAFEFKDRTFDYCILDESQAIKNATSESAKAARLLQATHRLALSGTPVENHLGELWSLFEFLNPGMLGSASVFRLGGAGARNPDPETRALLARALRPFILRRTKEQVAKDLPPKLEQTLYCELDKAQRKQYDDLRAHYRQSLLARIEREGLNRSKIQVLEALLRLRQAACHPGLLDKRKVEDSSAKLDVLLPQLEDVLAGGHKALVFSQFTSLLAIVRRRLDRQGIPYEYLDGRTRDRAARVERFQNDPASKLFLISLKAGGLGLNLTAADYVFLLDPWWNPAVEAQAIDRTHRIGQTQRVFAYRLIARDTVEEKVLELQKSKRDLADAIINADNSLIRNLERKDLELLLS
jgi:superfamily II DNA or RNA helicase